MTLFSIEKININLKKTNEIKGVVESTLRLIAFSRVHRADGLLNSYLSKTTGFEELLSIKDVQMEAQNEEEAKLYPPTPEKGFLALHKQPYTWNKRPEAFFGQEINRLYRNSLSVYGFVKDTGDIRGL